MDMNIVGGKIKIGSLTVSDVLTGGSQTRAFETSMIFRYFINEFLPNDPMPAYGAGTVSKNLPMYYGGTYGNWDLYSINFIKQRRYIGSSDSSLALNYKAEFNTSGGLKTLEVMEGSTTKLPYRVVINGGGAGFTFKIENLPRGTVGLVPGNLWVDPRDDILRIFGY